MTRQPIAAVLVLSLAACGTPRGPDYQRPASDLPATWGPAAVLPVGTTTVRASTKWWTIFSDPALDALMEEALARNRDLGAAAARVEQARAGLALADAARSPTVSADARASRNRATQVGAVPLPATVDPMSTTYRATLGIAWDVDFFGRYARATEAARADLLASEAGRDAVRLALTADVARGYFELMSLSARERSAQRALDTRAASLGLQQKRFQAGVANELELRQAQAERESARSLVATLGQQKERLGAFFEVLLGRSAKQLWEARLAINATPTFASTSPLAVPEGLPSQLLERRPDIRQTEQQLVAANARIGVAEVSYFPSFALTGVLGSESAAFSRLFTGPAGVLQLAAGAGLTLFDGGRRDAQVDQARAAQREALARYEKSVQAAFADTRAALAAQTAAREIVEAESARAASLARASELARMRFDAGLTSQLEALDAERHLLAAELARLDALATQRTAVVDLVRALGGGW